MSVFEFTCSDCGPFKLIPVDDVRRHIFDLASLWCPACGGPVLIDVVDDYEQRTPAAQLRSPTRGSRLGAPKTGAT